MYMLGWWVLYQLVCEECINCCFFHPVTHMFISVSVSVLAQKK